MKQATLPNIREDDDNDDDKSITVKAYYTRRLKEHTAIHYLFMHLVEYVPQ
jgi:hypothetical protein